MERGHLNVSDPLWPPQVLEGKGEYRHKGEYCHVDDSRVQPACQYEDDLESFELIVKSLSGNTIAQMPAARANWAYMDILPRLLEFAPLPSNSHIYKLVCGKDVLIGELRLGDCALEHPGSPQVIAVAYMSTWACEFEQSKQDLSPSKQLSCEFATFNGMRRKPPSLSLVMEAACCVLGVTPKGSGISSGEPQEDYWSAVQSEFFKKPDSFLMRLNDFDPRAEDIPRLISVLSPYIGRPDFLPELVFSRIAKYVCRWCRALYGYCEELHGGLDS